MSDLSGKVVCEFATGAGAVNGPWLRFGALLGLVVITSNAPAQQLAHGWVESEQRGGAARYSRASQPQEVMPFVQREPESLPSPIWPAQQACGQCGQSHVGVACAAATQPIGSVDSAEQGGAEERWLDVRVSNFDTYGQGEYAGPARLAHLAEYRLRPDDLIRFTYVVSRRKSDGDYRLMIGDSIMVTLVSDRELDLGNLDRGIEIQPDGYIHLDVLEKPVFAAGLTIPQLRAVLEERYARFYNDPSVNVKPVKTSTLAEDIRNAVGGRSGLQQQALNVTVMPDGKIRLPGIGGLCVQGFSLPELKKEINLRYRELVVGLEVEPILTQQADHFVYVLGQVASPGRIQLQGPTTVLGAIASAGGHVADGNMRQVVVLRRAEDWRLISTMLDLQGAVYGRRPTPADEIWLRDNDVVIIPNKPIVRLDNWIDQIFTRGIYGVLPITFNSNSNL